MKVERGTSTQGRNWLAKPMSTSSQVLGARRFHAAPIRTPISATRPVHHTAGLPMQEMEEIMPSGM